MNKYELLLNHNYSKVICNHTNYGQNVAVENRCDSFEHYEWSGFIERSLVVTFLKHNIDSYVTSQFFCGGCYREQGIDSWVYPQSGYSLLAFVTGRYAYCVINKGVPCWTSPELLNFSPKPAAYNIEPSGMVVDIFQSKK